MAHMSMQRRDIMEPRIGGQAVLGEKHGDDAVIGAANRFGWSRADSPAAQIALCAAAVAVVIEAASYLIGSPAQMRIGGLPVSAALVPLLIAGIASGRRCFGRARSREAAIVFWALCFIALVVGAVQLTTGRPPAAVLSLLLTGFAEEFMYRGAIPALATFALVHAGLPIRRAGLIGIIVGGSLFVVLPGHAAQWGTNSDAIPFMAFAALMALAVWRTGALFEVALLHAVLNIINISRLDGTSGSAGAVVLTGLFGVLMIAYIPSIFERHRLIDLTGPEPVVHFGRPGLVPALDQRALEPLRRVS